MKKYLAALFLFVACESDNQGRPVDTVFRATVISLDSTCNGDIPAPEVYAYVDVLYRSDGRVNISTTDMRLSGLRQMDGVELESGGQVSHSQSQEISYPETTYTTKITGTIEPEKMDVVLESSWELPEMEGTRQCEQKIRLLGEPRPFASAENVDGKYRARLTWYGYVCPDAPDPAPEDAWQAEIDARAYAPAMGKMSLLVADKLLFSPGLPGLNGRVDFDDVIYLGTYAGSARMKGKAAGVFLPEKVDLNMEINDFLDNSGCVYRLRLEGAKLLPNADSMENDYRVAYKLNDECSGKVESFDTTARIIIQDGAVELDDFMARAWLTVDSDGKLSGNFQSEGAVISYQGRINPPDLFYTVEYKVSQVESSCVTSYEGRGTIRGVFP